MFQIDYLISSIFCKSIKFRHVFLFVQVSYPKSISKEAKDICKGVGMSVVNVINIVSIVTFEKKKTLLVIKTQFGVKKIRNYK